MLETPKSVLWLSSLNSGLAKKALYLKAFLRHPTSPEKRNVNFRRLFETLLMDQRSACWHRPKGKLPDARDRCVKFPIAPDYIHGGSGCPTTQLSVICHMYYIDRADVILKYLANMPCPFRLFISTDTLEKKSALEAIFSSGPATKTSVIVVQNIGRDIAPKLLSFPHVLKCARPNDLVLFLHGKKSAESSDLENWSSYLYDTLLGSSEQIQSIIATFEQIPELGMIGPQHYGKLGESINWAQNKGMAIKLLDRMVGYPYFLNSIDFPSGSMFWSRPAALQSLFNLNLSLSDFPPETGQVEGTLSHTVERLFYISSELANLRWLKVVKDTSASVPCDTTKVKTIQDIRILLNSTPNRIVRPLYEKK